MSVKIRLRSDKTVAEIADAESGDRIKGLSKIVITHDIGSRPEAELHIITDEPAKYDAEAEATFLAMSTVAGEMKAVKRIEFEDGEIIQYGDPV